MRVLKYAWFVLVMALTGFWPDFKILMRMRGLLVRPCFKRCGRGFQVGAHVMILHTTSVSVGNSVYIAYGSWIQGVGGVTLEDEVMLGPYTVLASANHTKKDGSYRFGPGRHAPIVLKRGAWTGAHVVVTAGVTIGEGTACAAGAVVTGDVPAHGVVGGVPARVIAAEENEEG